jgi:hypothetical protein
MTILDIPALSLSGTNIADFVRVTPEKARNVPISTYVYGNICSEMIRSLFAKTGVEMRTVLKELYQKTFMTTDIDLESRAVKIHGRSGVKKVQAIVGVTAGSWGQAGLMKEQPSSQHIGPILQELEAGRHPERKDIADSSPMRKSYWTQWKSLVVSDGTTAVHQAAQIVVP